MRGISWCVVSVIALLFGVSFASAAATSEIEFRPQNPDGYAGETTTVQVMQDNKPVNWDEVAVEVTKPAGSTADDVTFRTEADGHLVLQAPASIPTNVPVVVYTITVKRKSSAEGAEDLEAQTTFHVGEAGSLEWESRAIVGWHQAGASSADSRQNLFFDFFVARPLGGGAVYDSRFGLWGQVRVASAPQQKTIPVSQFAAEFTAQLGTVPVNELAQSAEFLTGIEANLHTWRGRSRIRTLGFVGFFGANGAFSDPATQARVFRVPPVDSPQWTNFVSYFPEFDNAAFRTKAAFIGLVPPDRERFYREYGVGIRFTSHARNEFWSSPSVFTATIGQDQSITGGRYVRPALKFDAFYPFPLSFPSARCPLPLSVRHGESGGLQTTGPDSSFLAARIGRLRFVCFTCR